MNKYLLLAFNENLAKPKVKLTPTGGKIKLPKTSRPSTSDSLRGKIVLIDSFFDKIQCRVKLNSANSNTQEGNNKKKQRLDTLSETGWGNTGTSGQGAKGDSIRQTEASIGNHSIGPTEASVCNQ